MLMAPAVQAYLVPAPSDRPHQIGPVLRQRTDDEKNRLHAVRSQALQNQRRTRIEIVGRTERHAPRALEVNTYEELS
jgi:hypothetical protein